VVHASGGLEELAGPGAKAAVVGRPVEAILGEDLFGSGGTLRRSLEMGERREGWGSTLRVEDRKPRSVSLSAAPIRHGPAEICDPRVAYVVVVRSAGEDPDAGAALPTMFERMIGRSQSMLGIFRLVENLGESDATVLITGESGTGKELVARAVHAHSPRGEGPFVAVNCGALPGDLLESELFGHVRGAFTGAVRDRVGRFELAASGTIFLDEVGDMPLPLQVKLLRVLQERTFERVGESVSRSSDARVIAATNKNLRREIVDGGFREDLYYRLRVVPIAIPPLRERREDIEPLARHLLARVGRRHARSLRFAPGAMRALLRHDWPGNVRELENALEYAVAVCRGQTLHVQDLPTEISDHAAVEGERTAVAPDEGETPIADPAADSPGDPSAEPERQRIVQALESSQWRRSEAAAALGMSRTTLWRKMREYGLIS
jgi:DNA-binding NtrC family response regulator